MYVKAKFIVKNAVCCRGRLSHSANLTVTLTLTRMNEAAVTLIDSICSVFTEGLIEPCIAHDLMNMHSTPRPLKCSECVPQWPVSVSSAHCNNGPHVHQYKWDE